MRTLVWLTIGFSVACAVGAYLLSGVFLICLCVLCGVFAAVFAFLRTKHSGYRAVFFAFLGCTIGLCWFFLYDCCFVSTARNYDGLTSNSTITVTDYSYQTDYGVAADGKVTLDGKTFRVRVYLVHNQPLSPGDEVSGEFHLRFTGNGGEKEPTYHQAEGIFLFAYADKNVKIKQVDVIPTLYFAAVLRKEIQQVLTYLFPEDTVAFARALLLGDSSGLTYAQDSTLKVSGIRHVIAVSGLHVSILFSFVYQLCGKRRFLTAVFGIPVLLLFAAVAGFTPSVVRACIMQMLMILALLINKEYDAPSALAFAVLMMQAVNPLTVTSVSLQLSAGCMAGILLFSERINSYLLQEKRFGKIKVTSAKGRVVRWLSGSVSISVSAMLITTPLSAYYFGMVSVIGIITNLLCLWVVSFAFYGIMAAAALGAVWLPAGRIVAGLISWPIRYVLGVANLMAEIPVAAVYTGSIYILLWLVAAYALLAVFYFSSRKRPAFLVCSIVIGLVLSLSASWLEPKLDDVRVTVLDVGQGQSVLLQCKDAYYLVDCGGDTESIAADAAAQALLSQGITHIDGLLLTHYDEDHAGGAVAFLSRIKAEHLYLPDISEENQHRESLAASYSEHISWIEEETVLGGENFKITLFPGEKCEDDNESGMCVLFQAENCDILILGDRNSSGERFLLEQTQLPELELLVVGHHGSNASTSFDFLAATRPKNAVISVGAGNPYGHPHENVLKRLYLFGCTVQRTDLDGTIVYRG